MERYDPEENKWEVIGSMAVPRYYFGCCELQGVCPLLEKIIVCNLVLFLKCFSSVTNSSLTITDATEPSFLNMFTTSRSSSVNAGQLMTTITIIITRIHLCDWGDQ